MKLRLRPGSGVTGVLWPTVPAVAASVAGVELWMAHPNSQAASVAIALGTVVLYSALMALHLLGTWALNFTECTATGIRTRRLFWTWDVPWSQVSGIAAERVSIRARNPWSRSKIRAVRVRTTGGRSFLLGAPIDRGFRPDPEFDASVVEIQSCWRAAQVGLTGMEAAAPRRRFPASLAVGVAVVLLLAGAGVSYLAVASHGHVPRLVQAPASLLGASRDTGPDAQGTTTAVGAIFQNNEGSCLTRVATAVYGTPQIGFVVIGGHIRDSCTPASATELANRFMARGLTDAQSFPPGSHGGAQVCASLEVNSVLTIDCTWADTGTTGEVIFIGGFAPDLIGAASMTRSIRAAIER